MTAEPRPVKEIRADLGDLADVLGDLAGMCSTQGRRVVICPKHTALGSTTVIHDGFIGQCDLCPHGQTQAHPWNPEGTYSNGPAERCPGPPASDEPARAYFDVHANEWIICCPDPAASGTPGGGQRGLDARGRPICGQWSPELGPCLCADPENHQPGGKYAPLDGAR